MTGCPAHFSCVASQGAKSALHLPFGYAAWRLKDSGQNFPFFSVILTDKTTNLPRQLWRVAMDIHGCWTLRTAVLASSFVEIDVASTAAAHVS